MIKVLLSIPNNSPFYSNLFPSIKSGFEEAGCQVIGNGGTLEAEKLIQLIETTSPDIVFEMNRVKTEIPNYPEDLLHICWLVDYWGRLPHELHGSDILYTFSVDWIKNFSEDCAKKISYLPPGTNPKIYRPLNQQPNYDYSFFGHIPNPWTKKELLRAVGLLKNRKVVTFNEILPTIQEHCISNNAHKSLFEKINERFNINLNNINDKALMYDISSRAIRQYRRQRCINSCLKHSRSLEIFGTKNWLNYPEFKDFYKSFIESPSQINVALQNSKILLNDANDPHFRTFDAMANGTIVATALPPTYNSDKMLKWKLLGFEENADYIFVDCYHDNNNLQSILNNKSLLSDIAYNAQEKIISGHTWAHRVEQILNDVKDVRYDRS